MIGKQILHYRIEKLLSKSSMSSVYLATDIQYSKPVAVKAYNPYLVKGTKLAKHIKSEITQLTRLQHSHIAQVCEYVESPDGAYLIMEYIDGLVLDDYIKKANTPMPAEDIIILFLQILQAVAFAHRRDVLHTDVKPSNILITSDKGVKVLFYSAARFLAADTTLLTRTGFKLGTVLYKSPEQVYNKEPDVASDIYGLGVVLYEMISGKCPYSLQTHSEFEIQNKIVYEPLYKAEEIEAGLRGKLQMLVNKATAKNPEERFADCDDFIASIQEVQHIESEQQFQELMEEISVNSNSMASVEDNSVIRVAEKQKRTKTLQGVFAVFSLMIACMFVIAITYKYISEKKKYLPYAATANSAGATNVVSAVSENVQNTATKAIETAPEENTIQSTVPVADITSSVTVGAASESDLQFRVAKFYSALQAKDVEWLESFYALPLTRFFNEYGVSAELLNQLLEQSWERTPDAKYNILWETFRYSRDEKGNYVMDFYMNYDYKRDNRKSWETQKIYTMIKMDKDLKIYYITAD